MSSQTTPDSQPSQESGLESIPLPELKITEVDRSLKPLLPEGKAMLAHKDLGEYTMIIPEGSDQITLFDRNGDAVEDFAKISSIEPKSMSIAEYVELKGKSYINVGLNRNDNADYYYKIDSPPCLFGLRDVLDKAFLEQADQSYLNIRGFQNINLDFKFPSPQLFLVENGKYLVVLDKYTYSFICYKTQDDQGRPQPPRNWSRVDMFSLKSAEDVPASVNNSILSMEAKNSLEMKEIPSGYYASIQEDKMNFVTVNEDTAEVSAPVFTEHVSGVQNNLCSDPLNPSVIFYSRTSRPREIIQLDTSADPSTWESRAAHIPKDYDFINNLRFSPCGRFLLFDADNEVVVLAKSGLEEVGRLPGNKFFQFDGNGNLQTFDDEGHLVSYDINFDEMADALEQRHAAQLASQIDIGAIFAATKGVSATPAAAEKQESLSQFQPLKDQANATLITEVDAAINLEDLDVVSASLQMLKTQLNGQNLKPEVVRFIVEDVEVKVDEKRKEIAEPVVRDTIDSVRTSLATLSLSGIADIRSELDKIDGLRTFVETDVGKEIEAVRKEFDKSKQEFFRASTADVDRQVTGWLEGVKQELEAIDSKAVFEDWMEYTRPQLLTKLGNIEQDIPFDIREAHDKIRETRAALQQLAKDHHKRFELEYAKVRETAVQRIDAMYEHIDEEIEGFFDRLRSRQFTLKVDAQRFIDTGESKKMIDTLIEGIKTKDPGLAKTLSKKLKIGIAIALDEVERKTKTKIDKSGRQMVMFGSREFPVWEAAVKEKKQSKADLTFLPNENSKGPGVRAHDILGDIGIRFTSPKGKVTTSRLYEMYDDEEDRRLGGLEYRGEEMGPSYITQGEFRKLRKLYSQWGTKEKPGKLRLELQSKRKACSDKYKSGEKAWKNTKHPDYDNEINTDEYKAWREEYLELLQEYATFFTENSISHLRHIDATRNAPQAAETNGKGFVPEWSPHWTSDHQTVEYLEEMAMHFDMQGKLEEGILNLAGHAGTGKDVLIKMFCNKTKRPYFSIDCSKWMTEYELSEDVILESEDGVTQTVKVPSIVLTAIKTPGAVMYFNEINAMPEQAQIFLHGLLDEKRTLTSKASAGMSYKAHPSALLAASMNPGYPGTFDPQFATRSRMQTMRVGYPPLKIPANENDPNKKEKYNPAEALRVARSVDSLSDFTIDPNPDSNEFVQIWENYVNSVDNDAPALTPVQQFDLEVIQALVQFAAPFRKAFITKFEKMSDSASRKLIKDFPVTQPFTLREMRRCAWYLGNEISDEEKISKTRPPEQVAKELIEKYFLIHTDSETDRKKLRDNMTPWTSKKRAA